MLRTSHRRFGTEFALLLACVLSACNVPIAAGLDDPSANEAIVALERNGIAANKHSDVNAEGRYQLEVARDDASAAVNVLAQEGLPARPVVGVLDALGQGSVIPSRLSEHAKLTAGIAGELERSLREVDGVVSARVHLAVPPKDALAPEETPNTASASVLVRHRGATPPLAVADVQRLVSGAVPGLTPERVSVVATTVPVVKRAAERDLSHLGPIAVTRSSAFPLRVIVGAAVLLNLLLISSLLLLWQRLRKSEQALADRLATEGQNTP